MKKTEAIRAIKAMGLSARTEAFDPNEIRVTFPVANVSTALNLSVAAAREKCEAMAYYTTDPVDAFHTACAMKQTGIRA